MRRGKKKGGTQGEELGRNKDEEDLRRCEEQGRNKRSRATGAKSGEELGVS